MPNCIALEIKSPEIARLALAIDPTIAELDYEKDLYLSFLVIGFPDNGHSAIVPPETFSKYFDHIENGPTVVLKTFVKK